MSAGRPPKPAAARRPGEPVGRKASALWHRSPHLGLTVGGALCSVGVAWAPPRPLGDELPRWAGRSHCAAVLALTLLALLLSSCAVGPSARPPVAVRGPAGT